MRRAEARRERSEMLQLHREQVGQVKRPAMWRELLECVRNHIDLQRACFGGQLPITMRVDPGDQAFFVRRSQFPHVTVDCKFLAEKRIEIFSSYRQTDNADTFKWEEHIDFHVDELDRVQFQSKNEALIDANEVCLLILKPIQDLSFQPPSHANPSRHFPA